MDTVLRIPEELTILSFSGRSTFVLFAFLLPLVLLTQAPLNLTAYYLGLLGGRERNLCHFRGYRCEFDSSSAFTFCGKLNQLPIPQYLVLDLLAKVVFTALHLYSIERLDYDLLGLVSAFPLLSPLSTFHQTCSR